MGNYFRIIERNQKTSKLLKQCQQLFDVWTWQNFKKFDKDFPVPKELTIRYFKANIEADEELKNISVNDLPLPQFEYMTLRERLILELEYFSKTGEHLDIGCITLCIGSYNSDGYAPGVYWSSVNRKLSINWYNLGSANNSLRARQQFNPFD